MPQIVGMGTEIVECLRIARMIERYGELFLTRVYTSDEIRFCHNRKQSTQHFAARWAAKEAAFRALGITKRHGGAWRDVEVRSEPISGGVTFGARGAIRDIIEKAGVSDVQIAIAFCHTHATATAIAVSDEV